MNPTPIPEIVSSPSAVQPWVVIVVIGLITMLLVIGLITGQVRFTPSKAREAARRGILTMDAVFSTPEKQAAIEYIRDEEHLVDLDQERGEGTGQDDDGLD